jgi:hypothetical protein
VRPAYGEVIADNSVTSAIIVASGGSEITLAHNRLILVIQAYRGKPGRIRADFPLAYGKHHAGSKDDQTA